MLAGVCACFLRDAARRRRRESMMKYLKRHGRLAARIEERERERERECVCVCERESE